MLSLEGMTCFIIVNYQKWSEAYKTSQKESETVVSRLGRTPGPLLWETEGKEEIQVYIRMG